MERKRCLIVGGVADGRTIEIEGHLSFYRIPVLQHLSIVGFTGINTPPEPIDYEVEEYKVEEISTSDKMYYFLAPRAWDEDRMIMKLIEGYRPLLKGK